MHEDLARLYTFLTRDCAMRNMIDRGPMEFAMMARKNQTKQHVGCQAKLNMFKAI